jgi:hypothetical protein
VDTALALSCALYALLLDYNKQHATRKIDPDLTWPAFWGWCALCLLAARIRVRLSGSECSRVTERATLRAFLVGVAPIAIWQIWRSRHRRNFRESTLRHYITKDTHAKSPTRMAPLRWPGPSKN